MINIIINKLELEYLKNNKLYKEYIIPYNMKKTSSLKSTKQIKNYKMKGIKMNENNKLNELINNRLILKTEITKLTKDLDDVNSDIKLELELAESDFYNNIKGECISYKETTRNGFDSKKAKTYLNEEQLKEKTK